MTAQQAKRQTAAEQAMPVALAELALPGRGVRPLEGGFGYTK